MVFFVLQNVKIYLGSKGNKTETSGYTCLFLVMLLLSLFLFIYYSSIQTYVLSVEILFGLVGAILCLAELVLGFIAWISFRSLERSQ